MTKNIAIILAGGKGSRLSGPIPKQLLKIAGKKVVQHTLEVFERHPQIDEIALVSHPDYKRDVQEIITQSGFTKTKKILSGGKERYDSSLVAIRAYEKEDVNLIFHDAVRPLVSHRIISDCIEALKQYNAVDVAVKTTDTIISVKEKEIQNIPNRDFLYNGQTPQAFKWDIIHRAYEKALRDPEFKATDDCGVVKKYLPEEKVYVVNGDGYNMKLTYKEDIFLLDKLFQLRSISDVSQGLSEYCKSELEGKVLVIFGGSYGIGKEVKELVEQYGAKTYSFSRNSTQTNIADAETIKTALSKVYDREQKIDYVVNTAGILAIQALQNMRYEDIQKNIQINYFGAIAVAKESFPYLQKTEGMLLLYTSSSYTRGRGLYSLYSSSKAAIVNLTQALSQEWESVKINCINPERTKTPMRIKNFGQEPEDSLLSAKSVAIASVNTLFSDYSGQVIDIRRGQK